jgi:hypothetical protein
MAPLNAGGHGAVLLGKAPYWRKRIPYFSIALGWLAVTLHGSVSEKPGIHLER